MTTRPTSTKQRSQSADGSPCIARTSTSADGTAPGESELTAKAREVLAAGEQGFLVVDQAAHDAYDAAYDASDGDVTEAVHAARWARIDLAAEVARLLSEVQS